LQEAIGEIVQMSDRLVVAIGEAVDRQEALLGIERKVASVVVGEVDRRRTLWSLKSGLPMCCEDGVRSTFPVQSLAKQLTQIQDEAHFRSLSVVALIGSSRCCHARKMEREKWDG